MPTPAVCPNPACARRSTVPDGLTGRSVRCSACGTAFTAGSAPAPALPATHPEPQTIGRFVVRAKLGAGAFGTVYRAYDPQLDREVALKVPNAGVLDGPTRVERFLREAKAAANLRHPHVVPVYDAGRDGDRYFIASAFVDGKPLAEAIDDGGVDVDRAARLTRELAEALAYAHGEGIVHRDVKPANVMLDAADRVHLMDFGLAARADEASRLTTDGAVIGTPAYLAPENATGAAGDPQPAADQYACGVVLYELLTGRVPFEGPVPVVLHNQVHADPEPPRARRRAVSKDLETICLKALAKRPEHRYRDCQALADDLRRWQEGEPIAARKPGALEKAIRFARKKPTAAVAVVLGAVAVGLAAFGLSTLALLQGTVTAKDREAESRAKAEDNLGAVEAARKQLVAEQARTTAALAAAQAAEKKLAASLAGEKAARGQAEANQTAAEDARQTAEDARGKLAAAKAALEAQAYGNAIELAHEAIQDKSYGPARELLLQAPARFRGWEWRYADRLGSLDRLVFPGGTLTFAPGGRLALGQLKDRSVVWDADAGRRHHEFPAGRRVYGLPFTPDGAKVVTLGGADVFVTDLSAGGAERSFALPPGAVLPDPSSAWTYVLADGQRVAVHANKRVHVLDLTTGGRVGAGGDLEKRSFERVEYGAKANVFFTTTTDAGTEDAQVWDAGKLALRFEIKGPPVPKARANYLSWSAVLSRDGSRLAWPARNPTGFKLIDTATGKETAFVPAPPPAARGGNVVAFSPDGAFLAQGGDPPVVWDTRTGQKRCDLQKVRLDVSTYWQAWWADSARLFTTGPDSSVLAFDARTGRHTGTYRGHAGRVSHVGPRPGSADVFSYSADGTARVWNPTPPPPPVTTHAGGAELKYVAFDRDATRVVTNTDKGLFRVRDVATGKLLQTLPLDPKQAPTNNSPRRGGITPDGKRLFDGRGAWGVVWDVDAGTTVPGYTTSGGSGCLDVTRDGSRYATLFAAKGGGRLCVIDFATGKKEVEMAGRPLATVGAFTPAGGELVAIVQGSGVQNAVQVFDAHTGAAGTKFETPDAVALALAPDGTRAATGTRKGKVAVWDIATGKQLAALNGHTQWVHALAFSPDGTRVVSAGDDRTVRVWDPATGVCVLTLRGPAAPVLAARFTLDGKKIVAVDQTETITTWDATPVTLFTDPAVLKRLAPPPAAEPDPAPEGDRP